MADLAVPPPATAAPAPAAAPAPSAAPAPTSGGGISASGPPSDYGIGAARSAGYSDQEITSYLAAHSNLGISAAKAAKYSDTEILDHLSSASAAPKSSDAPDTNSGSAPNGQQSQVAADVNAVGQGLVGGTGAVIAGTGRQITAAAARMAPGQLAAMDAIDRGETVPADQDPIGYGSMSDDQKASMRADFPAAAASFAAHDPNAITKAGMAVESAAPTMFPVDPANEGIQTGTGRLLGGLGPALVATAAGTAAAGPGGGILAGAAAIGAQSFDSTYQEAVAKGASPSDADDAAGKAALAQIVTMSVPIAKVIPLVPVPLREGFVKTLVNIGQGGIEVGGGNSLATLAQNYVAQQSYDPTRSLTQGIGAAGLEGTIAGLVIRGGSAAAQAARSSAAAPEAVAAIGAAPDIDGAIAAAAKATAAPPGAANDATSGWGDLFGRPADSSATPAAAPDTGEIGSPFAAPSNNDGYDFSITNPAGTVGDTGAAPSPKPGSSIVPTDGTAVQSVGAAASGNLDPGVGDLSTTDMKANRRRAEMDQIIAPPQSNDNMIYVPGSFPTLAERSGDPVVSQYENLLRQRNPGEFVGDGKILTENNKARVNLFDENTVPDTTLNSMRADRAARWNAASDQILPTAKPADLTPVLDWVQQQLSNPRIQENDAVRSVLEGFRKRIVDPDGNLKTDPAAVWGIHDNLQNQLAKAKDGSMSSAEKYAQSQLLTAKSLIDQAMNVATDNRFQGALDGYAEDSKAINSGVLLNEFRPKLTNMAGDLQAQKFHNFVASLAKERGDPGIDPSMDISDQTMQSLINIDTDLKRAGLIKLGAAAGSPTNLLTALAQKAGLDAVHSLVGGVPVVGGILAGGQKYLAERKLISDTAKHIAPPEGGYTFPEPDEPQASPAPVRLSPPAAPPAAADLFNQPAAGASTAAPARMDAYDSEAAAAGYRRLAPNEPRTVGQQILNDPRTGRDYVPTSPAAAPPESTPVPTQLAREQAAVAAMKARSQQGAAPVTPAQAGNFYGATTALTPGGLPVGIRYAVREASDLTPSQLPDGRPNPAFPPELQPRDRTRAASMAQVSSMASALAPERLGYAADTATGAPVVGPDGMVESGNGRTMAIQKAYAEGSAAAANYRTWLAGQGFNIDGMQQPVLVRERTAPLDMAARAQLADQMGASPTMAMAAPERAAADAKRIPTDVLSMIQRGDVTSASNAPFVRAFATHAIPASEHASFMTADGDLSVEGATRVRNALTQRAYGSNDLVTSLAENADPDLKAFGGALVDAAGPMAKLRGAIEDGSIGPGNDITPALVEAARVIQTAKRARISIADAVAQTDAFAQPDPRTESVLRATFGDDFADRMSRPKMASLLANFAAKMQVQSGLFGEGKTADQVFEELARK